MGDDVPNYCKRCHRPIKPWGVDWPAEADECECPPAKRVRTTWTRAARPTPKEGRDA